MAEATLFRVTDEERRMAIELSDEKYRMYVEDERSAARREGLAEGSYQAKVELAASFKRLGVDIDKIAEGTGLSREKIEAL